MVPCRESPGFSRPVGFRQDRRWKLHLATRYSRIVKGLAGGYDGRMKGVPGTLQEGGAAFAPTHWSVVLLTAQSRSPEAAPRRPDEPLPDLLAAALHLLAPPGPFPGRRAGPDPGVLRPPDRTQHPGSCRPGKGPATHFPAWFAPALPGQRARPRHGPQTWRRPADRLPGRPTDRSRGRPEHRRARRRGQQV